MHVRAGYEVAVQDFRSLSNSNFRLTALTCITMKNCLQLSIHEIITCWDMRF